MKEYKIMITEDCAFTREFLRIELANNGYTVSTASNGREALDLLRSQGRPDLIILDLKMPVMSGYKFREEQLNDNGLKDIPVILYSSENDLGTIAEALKCIGFLEKNVTAAKLVAEINKVLTA